MDTSSRAGVSSASSFFEDELADFSAFFGSLEWFREIPDQITARRKGHTSPTYRGAVRLDNNREAFR